MKTYCRQCGYLLGPGYIEDQEQYPGGICERCQDEEIENEPMVEIEEGKKDG